MIRLFHGCTYANFDGTGKLIHESHKCLVPTDKCFWKDACDVTTQTKVQSMTKNEGAVVLKIFKKYFKDKGKDNDLTFVYFILKEYKRNLYIYNTCYPRPEAVGVFYNFFGTKAAYPLPVYLGIFFRKCFYVISLIFTCPKSTISNK